MLWIWEFFKNKLIQKESDLYLKISNLDEDKEVKERFEGNVNLYLKSHILYKLNKNLDEVNKIIIQNNSKTNDFFNEQKKIKTKIKLSQIKTLML